MKRCTNCLQNRTDDLFEEADPVCSLCTGAANAEPMLRDLAPPHTIRLHSPPGAVRTCIHNRRGNCRECADF